MSRQEKTCWECFRIIPQRAGWGVQREGNLGVLTLTVALFDPAVGLTGGSVSLCRGEERAELKGEALNFSVSLHSYNRL